MLNMKGKVLKRKEGKPEPLGMEIIFHEKKYNYAAFLMLTRRNFKKPILIETDVIQQRAASNLA